MTKKKILAFDDDEMVLNYLMKKLGDRYTVVTSTEANLAVKLALQEKPDLILCDIDMPDLDGGEVCEALSSNAATAQIPFMYLTSMVSVSEAQDLYGMLGGRPGVAKDAPLPRLIAAIDELILPRDEEI